MRKFNMNVNGKNYVVEIEEQGASEAPQAEPIKAAAPVQAQASASGGTALNSPMPGLVKALKAKNGDTVKKGDVVLVLEAMKMENDIASPSDGIISFSVSEGANVNSGDVLFTVA